MAKTFSFAELATAISKVDDLGSISTDNKFSEITEWVGLGNYLLNAQVSASLFGGAPNKRSIMLAGPSGTGKTFLALNMAREAINQGYDILWLDSEAAVDKHTFEKFGLDTSKIYYQPAQTIKQVAGIIANACAVIDEKLKKKFEVPKLYVVIDSLGNLSSGKERADILEGNDKRDMTKQQELGGMFRVITTDIAKVGGILVCTNHTYDCLSIGHSIQMSDGLFKDISLINVGDYVKTLEGDKVVVEIFQYENAPLIELELETGELIKCTENHKFLVETSETQYEWKCAVDLNENDTILKVDS